jgi:hypothetical protein
MDSNDTKKVPTPKMTRWFNPCAGIMRWDSLDSIILALTLIWAGIIFLSANLGFMVDAWSFFFFGAGTLVLLEVTIRLFVQAYRSSIASDLVWAGILFWLGGWDFILPVAIVSIGVFILYRVYDHKRVQVD